MIRRTTRADDAQARQEIEEEGFRRRSRSKAARR